MIKSKNKSELLRFMLVGLLAIFTDITVYYVLIHLFPFALAKCISFTCGGIIAYLLNKYWTFEQNEKSLTEVMRFTAANICALGVNVFVNEIVLQASQQAVFLALIIATTATAIFTFVTFKIWVFKVTK